jgi:hypothetical protein
VAREVGVDGATLGIGCGEKGGNELPEMEHGVAAARAGAAAADWPLRL